jgi:hypothetical protein
LLAVEVLAERPARTRRRRTGCCARWPARACSPNPNPVFRPDPLGQTLTSSQPGSMPDLAIRWTETRYAPFAELTHTIRTSTSRSDPSE